MCHAGAADVHNLSDRGGGQGGKLRRPSAAQASRGPPAAEPQPGGPGNPAGPAGGGRVPPMGEGGGGPGGHDGETEAERNARDAEEAGALAQPAAAGGFLWRGGGVRPDGGAAPGGGFEGSKEES
eukprot:556550-Prorocentrum_minimum.AAC.5